MNIFVTDSCPIQSARNLPDKHIVKMPLETCQMLAIIYSDWYYGVGKLYKSDGTPYRTAHGAFRKHPCTQWAAANPYNLAWLIRHGYALCHEYNPTLQQSAHLSRRYRAGRTYLSQVVRQSHAFTRITQGRRLHTCHARVPQVRHYYRHYHCIQAVSQHQAVAS